MLLSFKNEMFDSMEAVSAIEIEVYGINIIDCLVFVSVAQLDRAVAS